MRVRSGNTPFRWCRIRLRHDTREEANMLRFFTCWNRISPRAKQPRNYFDRDQGRERQYVYRGASEIFRGYREWLDTREARDPEARMWIRMSHGVFKYIEHVAILRKKAEILSHAGMPFDPEPLNALQETLGLCGRWPLNGKGPGTMSSYLVSIRCWSGLCAGPLFHMGPIESYAVFFGFVQSIIHQSILF